MLRRAISHPDSVLHTSALTIGYTVPRQPPVVVARDLSLLLRGGQLVCLLGPNGVGKSTLMRTLAAMQKPLGGQVFLNGVDIHRVPARQVARLLSVVLTERPNVGLLNGYALVALGRHPHTDWQGRLTTQDVAMVRWAVEAVGAQDVADRPVLALSDGQRQKLMIARALAQEAQLILLDEPTAYLDLPRRVEVMHLLRHLAHTTGRAILLSTHDLDLALRTADQVWLMAGGVIRAGSPEDLVLNGAFEAAFSSEGITFDPAAGTFRIRRETLATVMLHGQGLALTWARRALERAGCVIVPPDVPCDLCVQLEGDGTVARGWVVDQQGQHAGQCLPFESLESLLAIVADLTMAQPLP